MPVPAQMAEVAKVPGRKRRSVSAPLAGTLQESSTSMGASTNPRWEERQSHKDVLMPNRSNRRSLGPVPEDEAGLKTLAPLHRRSEQVNEDLAKSRQKGVLIDAG